MAKPFLSVIIPAYNEALRLPNTLIDIDRHLRAQDYTYEIIVINDGSDDTTSKVVKNFSSFIRNLKLIENPGHRGKGAAARVGMIAAKGTWRLLMDADNAISISEFNKILPLLLPGGKNDILIASRGVSETQFEHNFSLLRRVLEWKLNKWNQFILKLPCKDFLLGFHCFSAEAAEHVFSLIKLSSWSYAQESLFLGTKLGYSIKEFPVYASHAKGSHFLTPTYLQMFWETIKIWWWHRQDAYRLSLQIKR